MMENPPTMKSMDDSGAYEQVAEKTSAMLGDFMEKIKKMAPTGKGARILAASSVATILSVFAFSNDAAAQNPNLPSGGHKNSYGTFSYNEGTPQQQAGQYSTQQGQQQPGTLDKIVMAGGAAHETVDAVVLAADAARTFIKIFGKKKNNQNGQTNQPRP